MEVDQYITQLEAVIRSYKEKDSAINNALISAQIMANNIINDANKNAGVMKVGAVTKLDAIIASIAVQKRMVKDFHDDYNRLVSKYLTEFNDSDILNLYSRIHDLEEYMLSLAADNAPAQQAPQTQELTVAQSGSGWL